MAAADHKVEPHIFIILGATGDLWGRKLLPALHRLALSGKMPPPTVVLGVGIETNLNDGSFRDNCRKELTEAGVPAADFSKGFVEDRLYYQPLPKPSPETYKALGARIEALEAEHHLPGNRVFYLALPPAAFAGTITGLGEAGLADSKGWTRLVIEKPFGRDLASAEKLNAVIHAHFDEKQIYRIDHYLGKETVQNLLVFRFANSLFEPLWNRDRIASVEITVAETLGVEHRASYYETAGALRDMIQNHLTQLLTITAMEVPASFGAESIRQEKAKVLESVAPIKPDDIVYGQYARGTMQEMIVNGYREEPGVNPNSQIETYVALRLEVANWRWHGVPFFLRTGKRLQRRVSQIAISFRCPPVSMFQPFTDGCINANALVITIQPDEGFDLSFEIKAPGEAVQLQSRSLHFRYAEAFVAIPEAYDTLLRDVVEGDPTLFVRDDWEEASWKIYTPLLERKHEVFPYPAGSWGPEQADRLLHGLTHGWMVGD